jgi:hypothetical protein
MVRMSADNWRDLARRAETIADLLELRSQEVTQRQQPKSPSMPAPEEND